MDAFEIPSAGSGSALGFLSDSESASFPRKARSACTRCHSQKLRCVRRNDQLRCERCLKLKTNCRFEARASRASLNPAGRAELGGNDDWHDPVSSTNLSVLNSGACSNHDIAYINHTNWRLPQNSGAKVAETRTMPFSSPYSHMEESLTNIQDSWSPINFQNPLNWRGSAGPALISLDESEISYGTRSSGFVASDFDTFNDDYSENTVIEDPLISASHKLASLSTSLAICADQLPFTSLNCVQGSRKTKLFALDELFLLTSEFLELTKLPAKSQVRQDSVFMLMDDDQLSSRTVLGGIPSHAEEFVTQTGSILPSTIFSHPDEPTMSLFFACHTRLTEMYSSVFQMMQACIQHSQAPKLSKDWAIILPKLEVGSVTSPPLRVDIDSPMESLNTSAMYMLMIAMVSSQLWKILKNSMSEGSWAQFDPPSNPGTLTYMMRQTMVDRTDGLLRTIDSTQKMLHTFPSGTN